MRHAARFTVTPVGAGACIITVKDKKGTSAAAAVTVIGARIAFSSSAPD